ncbi:hypothetical protein JDV02_007155 [Purpureocillium takamizusanense]|uniref:DUF202 domain-containing protein n=1 Tax=Purpureocillium takamizusanense TaxID=2060973 RepID=A0A9Q8VDR4_9HYPO|nr:uncharacterized protein JDV02_007155 [Purpureocillium takamizusanense]UNI21139.1 hypothetical protein JDV02_007155 [Purpureocillium takamizusanense]
MFQPHPEEHLHLRLHRARSVVLTSEELVEIRAAQRTFEGAYMRTALGQFSFALVVLKIFTEEFYAIGALFAAYGAAVLLVAVHRRYQGQRQFFTHEGADGVARRRFKTSGDTVLLMTALSLAAYATLLVLTWNLV